MLPIKYYPVFIPQSKHRWNLIIKHFINTMKKALIKTECVIYYIIIM